MNQQITDGTTVYDASGEKIGRVRASDTQGGYLDVEKGWLFPKDVYIPLSAIARSDADGVYLTLYKDDLSANTYAQPPQAGGMGTMQTVETTTAAPRAQRVTGTQAASTTGAIVVPEYEEELVAGTRQEQIGDVHLHKDVVTEQESVPVTLRREEVTVERVPVDQAVAGDTTRDAFQNKDIDVPVMGEEAVVGKQVRETEEVRLRKQATTVQQQVTDTVRKERVVVDGTDDTLETDSTTRGSHL